MNSLSNFCYALVFWVASFAAGATAQNDWTSAETPTTPKPTRPSYPMDSTDYIIIGVTCFVACVIGGLLTFLFIKSRRSKKNKKNTAAYQSPPAPIEPIKKSDAAYEPL